MFSAHSFRTKILLTFLVVCVVIVFSGLGVFAFPKPAKAVWPVTIMQDLTTLLENILLVVWKAALYPLIRDVMMAAASRSDFLMTSEQLAQWFTEKVLFQAANVVFKRLTAHSLCVNINWNLKLALTKFVAEGHDPKCTFDQSKIAQFAVLSLDDKMDAIRKELPNMLTTTVSGSNNDINLSLEAALSIMDLGEEKKDSAKTELFNGKGLFTARDCSVNSAQAKAWGRTLSWYDLDDDGMVDPMFRPDHCRKINVEGQLAAAIIKNHGAAGDEFGETLRSQIALDVMNLSKMALGTAIESYALDPLKKWLAEFLLDDGDDSSTAIIPTYTKTGDNRLIEFPSDVVTPTGTTSPPDLTKTKAVEKK
ncbi:MAG: hypothetical protein HQ530_03135 [Parcubacteria group bacterium]|nr:hypothetical protein [Parcubacteria group bacterium]